MQSPRKRPAQPDNSRRQLTTYYRSEKKPESLSPFKRKTPKIRGRKILFGAADLILLSLLLIGLIYSLLLKPQPKVIVDDSSYHSAATYKSQIAPMFEGLKNRNKISFDEGSVVKSIQKKFPEVQTAKVELPFFSQEPVVWLNISKPAFKLISGGTFIVDSGGLAVAKADQLPKLNNLVVLTDQSGFQAAEGKQILSSQAVSFINTVIAQSKRAKVPISSMSLPPLAQELDLRTSDAPYFVKFYLGGDALNQSGQFLATRQKFIQTKQFPEQYLDVRVLGKIFYK